MAPTPRTRTIAGSIARAAGAPLLADVLAGLPGSALTSLLLEVHRRRAGKTGAADVAAAGALPLFQPSAAGARLLHRFDAAAFQAAAGFEALDLSPVVPFAACAALGGTDQNNVLTAARAAEVLADPTVALALAAATRRRGAAQRRAEPVRLCASARTLRAQSLQGAPAGFTPHFRLFALVTAGRDRGEHRFETDALAEHAVTWLRLLAALRADGFRVGDAEVEISDAEAVSALCAAQGLDREALRGVAVAHRPGAGAELLAQRGIRLPAAVGDPRRDLGSLHARLPAPCALRLDRVLERVAPAVTAIFPGTPVRLDLSRLEGLGYYPGLMLRIRLRGPGGLLAPVDGGLVPWTGALLADRKERLLASAIGSELICKACGPAAP